MSTIKELPEYFSGRGQVKGYVFNQLKKSDKAYLYEVKGVNIHYEVFERKENTMYNCVSYPTDKAFGLWAYTTNDIEKANELFKSIENRVELRELEHGEG